MNIIVTGGAGFIGTNLCKELIKLGHKVTSIDNYSTGKEQNHIEGIRYENFDIRKVYDYKWVYNKHPDVIFHLAAIARIQPSFNKPKEYFTTNANGTLEITDYCARNNVPLIYAGSSSHHSGKFSNPYTFSKDIGEEIIKLYQEHYNLKSSIVRFYNVYGPYQLTEGGYTTLIGRWLNNIEKGIECEIYGDGEQRRDFTHVDDIIDALIRIMDKRAYKFIFELGRGKNYSVNEVAQILNIKPVYKPSKLGEARETLNTDRSAQSLLGWEPNTNLEDYLG
jgi:UDP-glucose 4-epimerase|tara:strand:- start:5535 stop:6371 length:837 start_codon:yes stop_codon:yes gene_type:complete